MSWAFLSAKGSSPEEDIPYVLPTPLFQSEEVSNELLIVFEADLRGPFGFGAYKPGIFNNSHTHSNLTSNNSSSVDSSKSELNLNLLNSPSRYLGSPKNPNPEPNSGPILIRVQHFLFIYFPSCPHTTHSQKTRLTEYESDAAGRVKKSTRELGIANCELRISFLFFSLILPYFTVSSHNTPHHKRDVE